MMRQICFFIFAVLLTACNVHAQEYRDLVADMTESHLASVNHESWKATIAKLILAERKDCSEDKAELLADQYLGERYNQVVIDLLAPRFEKIMTFDELQNWNEIWLQTEIIRVNQMINECVNSSDLCDANAADFQSLIAGKTVSVKQECQNSLLVATKEYLEDAGFFGFDNEKIKDADKKKKGAGKKYKEIATVRVANAFLEGGVTEELLDEMKTVSAYPEYKKMLKEIDCCLVQTKVIEKALEKDLPVWLKEH